MKVQTEAICLVAVSQYGIALRYVIDQTEVICLAAIKRNGFALQYVKKQTQEMCLLALSLEPLGALKYVDVTCMR